MNTQYDPFATTLVLPEDELAARREEKPAPQLTAEQVKRLLVAAELRKRANQGE